MFLYKISFHEYDVKLVKHLEEKSLFGHNVSLVKLADAVASDVKDTIEERCEGRYSSSEILDFKLDVSLEDVRIESAQWVYDVYYTEMMSRGKDEPYNSIVAPWVLQNRSNIVLGLSVEGDETDTYVLIRE